MQQQFPNSKNNSVRVYEEIGCEKKNRILSFILAWFTIGEHYQSTWIGLSDLDRESAFTWSDGSTFAYINWADIGTIFR